MAVSSTYSGNQAEAARGRLNNAISWAAGFPLANEWLQVYLGRITFVCKVATQGMNHPTNSPAIHPKWVKKYKIRNKMDQDVDWQDYKENGIVKVDTCKMYILFAQ